MNVKKMFEMCRCIWMHMFEIRLSLYAYTFISNEFIFECIFQLTKVLLVCLCVKVRHSVQKVWPPSVDNPPIWPNFPLFIFFPKPSLLTLHKKSSFPLRISSVNDRIRSFQWIWSFTEEMAQWNSYKLNIKII